jgi:hypothetical protein
MFVFLVRSSQMGGRVIPDWGVSGSEQTIRLKFGGWAQCSERLKNLQCMSFKYKCQPVKQGRYIDFLGLLQTPPTTLCAVSPNLVSFTPNTFSEVI